MNITAVEPFFTGSHESWLTALQQHSRHRISILSLPGRFWKWRMHGGAVTMARQYMKSGEVPDLLLFTDMLDAAAFLALTREQTAHIPTAVYFHENQLTYPVSSKDTDRKEKRDNHYAFVNFTSALCCDRVLFNSEYHRSSFLNSLHEELKMYPDFQELESVAFIGGKSTVLPLGLSLSRFDDFQTEQDDGPPVILWNHRWEYDKNPDGFYRLLAELKFRNVDFRLVLLGETFTQSPAAFQKIRQEFSAEIIHAGFAGSFDEYANWCWRAHLLPVTSKQDFFGGSIMEAVYCGTTPLLPERLSYPELYRQGENPEYFYAGFSELVDKAEALLTGKMTLPSLRRMAAEFNWVHRIQEYDNLLEGMAHTP